MSKQRKTIGRTLSQSPLNTPAENGEFTQTFIMRSGKRAVFRLEHIDASDVANQTFVLMENNGRDQAALTKASLQDITRTLRFQQFFAAIGRKIDGKIEILDGSRRRAAAIICKTGLNVLVTDSEITTEDARQLAKDIQTAKEHNLREVGLRLSVLKDNGMSQKEIAEDQGLSQAKVTRALQAASVPQELLTVFPVQSELSYPDYKLLLTFSEHLAEKQIPVDSLLKDIDSELTVIHAREGHTAEDVKNAVLGLLRRKVASLIAGPAKDKVQTTPLWNFAEKDRFARKKSKGRMFSYEFNRVPKALHDELDNAIEDILSRHLKNE
ncbi:ParB/RepB/Spo0J family partition protein [Buttiauxella sp. B2]|uniref:ParB family protein n=1 Tax=Buttiauxella sp. B2 TaxID=2587812 RepID=UPI00111D8C58|nr:ParB family protein [Buttiauxella sp. B2]TNV12489.1 ParB/RepB/Spo0J family partition protein [Buttiauxella sp. B2]